VLDLIRRLEAIDLQLSGSGPRDLPAIVEEELQALL
jgi:hypothetical protein